MTLDPEQLNVQAAAIAARIAAADPVGKVCDYQPLPTGNDWSAFIDAFTAGDRIQAWTVQYLGERSVPGTISLGSTHATRHVRWKVRLHLSWSQALDSEREFRTLLRTVVLALNADMGLGGTALTHDPCSVDTLDGAGLSLGGVLVHFAEVEIVAKVHEVVPTHT